MIFSKVRTKWRKYITIIMSDLVVEQCEEIFIADSINPLASIC